MENNIISEILTRYPFASEFFEQNRLNLKGFEDYTLGNYLAQLKDSELEEKAIVPEDILVELELYIEQIKEFLGIDETQRVHSITILPGQDKEGNKENFEEITITTSQIISIVGPTGSGKSRLLADIEWVAQGDTPTERNILINGKTPDLKWRFSSNNKLVAQLSQNMNFVIDLTVGEFLELHAQSRIVENPKEICQKILEAANDLAGEKFSNDTPVTGLSGGQSRALMIADTAILSSSPIVLIDEIENAGIDRKKALNLLVSKDKIVLMATHDPLLALMADQRIVIRNGGVYQVLKTTEEEKRLLNQLNEIDVTMQSVRQKLRNGEVLCEKDCLLTTNYR